MEGVLSPLWGMTFQFSSVAKSCLTLCGSLLKLMSIKLVMPSNHLILCHPSSPAFILSQHQGLFQWVSFLHQVAKVLELQPHIRPSSEYSGLISFGLTALIALESRGLSRVFSNTTVQKHQFLSAQLCLWFNSHIHMTTGKTIALTDGPLLAK